MLLLLLACQSPPKDGTPDAHDSADTTPAPTGDSRDDAIPLEAGASVADTIDPVGDADWFAVDLAEGEFLRFQTVSVEGDPAAADFACDGSYDTDPIDTVVRVYDPDGDEVVAADDWPRRACGGDTIGMVRADVAGTWTLEIEDWNNWEAGGAAFGNPPVGGPEYAYSLYTEVISAEDGGGALGVDPVVATLDGETDVWDLHVDAFTLVTLYHQVNTNADVEDLVMELTDASGRIVAYTDSDAWYGTRWGLGVIAPVDPGDYSLRVWGGDWYWLWSDLDEDSGTVPESEPDDEIAIATQLEPIPGEGEYAGEFATATFSGQVYGHDVDVFSLDVTAGQYVYLTLDTTGIGSQLAAPAVVITGADGVTELASADGAPVSVTALRMPDDGTITIAVSGIESSGYYLGSVELWDERRPW